MPEFDIWGDEELSENEADEEVNDDIDDDEEGVEDEVIDDEEVEDDDEDSELNDEGDDEEDDAYFSDKDLTSIPKHLRESFKGLDKEARKGFIGFVNTLTDDKNKVQRAAEQTLETAKKRYEESNEKDKFLRSELERIFKQFNAGRTPTKEMKDFETAAKDLVNTNFNTQFQSVLGHARQEVEPVIGRFLKSTGVKNAKVLFAKYDGLEQRLFNLMVFEKPEDREEVLQKYGSVIIEAAKQKKSKQKKRRKSKATRGSSKKRRTKKEEPFDFDEWLKS